MERKLYIWFSGLVALAGIVLALHLLRIEDSIPPFVKLQGRHSGFSVSRDHYVRTMLLAAFLLPVICWLFSFVAHVGREIDIVSWIFVAGFYAAIWWLSWEVDHAYQINDPRPVGFVVGSVSDPTSLLLFAIGAGLGFWKWKQDWDPSIS